MIGRRRISVETIAVLITLGVILTGAAPALEPIRFYVGVDGDDDWSGTLPESAEGKNDGPFATLERARDAVREFKRASGIPAAGFEVVLKQGRYILDKPFELTAQDSGTEISPVCYRAAEGHEVKLVGGKDVTDFKPVTNSQALKQLDEKAAENVVQADLKALGITDYGGPTGTMLEVFFNDKPMILARWPDEGFDRIADIVVDDGHKIHGRKGSKVGKFVYEGNRPERWVDEKDPWVHGYWFWDWADERQAIEDIDTEKSVITLAQPYHSYGYRKGQWYYAYNILAELDRPGEWYIDRETGILYFWPPSPIESARTVVSVLPQLITMRGVCDVTLRGLTLETARCTPVTIENGVRVHLTGCTIRNAGGWAVRVSGGSDCTVAGCDIYGTGHGGIALRGGDRGTLSPAHHLAENNHIHHYSRVKRMYQPAVTLHGVGNRAAHNLIHSAPHMAMGFGGNDHVIEFNEIHDVCYESNDAGAIYTGRNWTMRGNVIRYNYLHHITGFEGRGCVGVYLDDMFSSATIYGNLFYKVTRAAFIGGGRNCTVENNIFVDCDPALHVDARALGWAHYHADEWLKEAKDKGTISGIQYKKPPYSHRFPELVNIIENEPKAPKGNLIARNIFHGGKWDGIHAAARPYLELKNNLIDQDPRFVDPENLDFRLKPDSPAFDIGFRPIPIDRIGLRPDHSRATWPVQHATTCNNNAGGQVVGNCVRDR